MTFLFILLYFKNVLIILRVIPHLKNLCYNTKIATKTLFQNQSLKELLKGGLSYASRNRI